mgnify:CR=1 FL=1
MEKMSQRVKAGNCKSEIMWQDVTGSDLKRHEVELTLIILQIKHWLSGAPFPVLSSSIYLACVPLLNELSLFGQWSSL